MILFRHFRFFSLVFSLSSRFSDFVIFIIHDFHDFMNQVPSLCWLESLGPVFLFNFFFFFELFYQLLRLAEEKNSIGLFDTGFSFKSIHDSQQDKTSLLLPAASQTLRH